MRLITSNVEFANNLLRCITTYPSCSIATAWASADTPFFQYLKNNLSKAKKVIIGTHFYQTHPDVLSIFAGARNVAFILQPSGVFHPKLYLFWSQRGWEALIGSANLTKAAMSVNAEAMVLVTSKDGVAHLKDEIVQAINVYWEAAHSVTEITANAYRAIWNSKQRHLKRLRGEYGSMTATKATLDSAVMSMSWEDFFEGVKNDAHHRIEERCDLLDFCKKAFNTHTSLAAMGPELRKVIAGLPNSEHEHWGWFGSMRGNGTFWSAINANNTNLSQALDIIPRIGVVDRAEYNAYLSEFERAFPRGRGGVATATRLLAMKRPDQFICLDAANRVKLCRDFGLEEGGIDFSRYWDEIIERIIDAPWWNSTVPEHPLEKRVWAGRAALLDSIFYDPNR